MTFHPKTLTGNEGMGSHRAPGCGRVAAIFTGVWMDELKLTNTEEALRSSWKISSADTRLYSFLFCAEPACNGQKKATPIRNIPDAIPVIHTQASN